MTRRSAIEKLSLNQLGLRFLDIRSDLKKNSNYETFQARLNIPNVCENLLFSSDDLVDEGELGQGAYGFVNRMVHKPTKTVMAVKVKALIFYIIICK